MFSNSWLSRSSVFDSQLLPVNPGLWSQRLWEHSCCCCSSCLPVLWLSARVYCPVCLPWIWSAGCSNCTTEVSTHWSLTKWKVNLTTTCLSLYWLLCPALSLSYNANSQPASYSQNSYSQPAAYGQQQPGYQAQQASYGQQQGYQQQGQQQQAPPAYPPQAASSYGQPPANQYSQQGGPPSYNQSNHYSKICYSPTSDCCFLIFMSIIQCHCQHALPVCFRCIFASFV